MDVSGWVGGWVGRWENRPAGDFIGDLDEVRLELLVVVGHADALPSSSFRGLEHHGVACGEWVGGWVGGLVEEKEAVQMGYCELWVDGWVKEEAAVGMSYCEPRVGWMNR